jgi:hypothetical protein
MPTKKDKYWVFLYFIYGLLTVVSGDNYPKGDGRRIFSDFSQLCDDLSFVSST